MDRFEARLVLTIRTSVLVLTDHDDRFTRGSGRSRYPPWTPRRGGSALGRRDPRRRDPRRRDPGRSPGGSGGRSAGRRGGGDSGLSALRRTGRASHFHGLSGPGFHPGPGRVAPSRNRGPPGRRYQRQDHSGSPGGRPGPGGRRHCRVPGSGQEPGSGGGRLQGNPAGVARGPDAGLAGRGAGYGGDASPGSSGGLAAAGSARSAGPGREGTGHLSPAGRSNTQAGGHSPAGGSPADRPGAARVAGIDCLRGRGSGRSAARAEPASLDQIGSGRSRPADPGQGYAESKRAARQGGRSANPLRGRRTSRRLSCAGRATPRDGIEPGKPAD